MAVTPLRANPKTSGFKPLERKTNKQRVAWGYEEKWEVKDNSGAV